MDKSKKGSDAGSDTEENKQNVREQLHAPKQGQQPQAVEYGTRQPDSPTAQQITYKNGAFDPSEVVLKVGGKLTIKNEDDHRFSVTFAGGGPLISGGSLADPSKLGSGGQSAAPPPAGPTGDPVQATVAPGKTLEKQFNSIGEYVFRTEADGGPRGKVTVVG